jgi:hypothetical protein
VAHLITTFTTLINCVGRLIADMFITTAPTKVGVVINKLACMNAEQFRPSDAIKAASCCSYGLTR